MDATVRFLSKTTPTEGGCLLWEGGRTYEWNDPELVALIKKQYADKFIMEKAFVKEAAVST